MDGGQQTRQRRGGSAPPPSALRRGQGDLPRLEAALRVVARLVIANPVYAPIFRRLEHEIALEKAALAEDVIAWARAIIAQNDTSAIAAQHDTSAIAAQHDSEQGRAQNEIGASNSAVCSSEAPSP
ncbi:hypothetical protein ACTTAL_06395 [Rhodobacter capsulatus]|uniref:hypothetical protein n=1 Tax=Rhodobacter capsulatus TaxID=1061 RepID=UPI00103D84CE|nr:hypothetical protein [Rhodobacter capsulatus]